MIKKTVEQTALESLQKERDKRGDLNYQAKAWSEKQRNSFFDLKCSLVSYNFKINVSEHHTQSSSTDGWVTAYVEVKAIPYLLSQKYSSDKYRVLRIGIGTFGEIPVSMST